MDLELGLSLETDYVHIRDELGDQEREYLAKTRRFVEEEVLPVIGGCWERAEFPFELARRMGELGLVGDAIKGYGCPEMSAPSSGLIAMELSRGDGSLATFAGVQAGLAMRSIAQHRSGGQKERWLGPPAPGEGLWALPPPPPPHRPPPIPP